MLNNILKIKNTFNSLPTIKSVQNIIYKFNYLIVYQI
nr:MAG TPA: hypothetical protein [Bacteriophage sp.]